jgi:phosphoglycolate phosphatase
MIRCVFFDLDGTLLDTRPGIFRCVRQMLATLNQGERGDDEIMAIIGPPLTVGFSRLLRTDDLALIHRAVECYRDEYAASGMYEAVVYDGIPKLCEDLFRKGVGLRVVTSKAQPYAEKIIKHFGLDRYFSRVYGPDLAGKHSDKTELIALALEAEGLLPEDVVMIGDREYDIIGARGNGVRSFGALWGCGSREELFGAGADVLVTTPSAVIASIG